MAEHLEQRGHQFADELFALVHRLGPPELDIHQRDAMADYLLKSAVEWARAENRATLTTTIINLALWAGIGLALWEYAK